MPCKPIGTTDEATIRRVFDINVFAHFWMINTFLPEMKAQNKGHIVSISSMAGVMGLKNLVPYCASKFAVRGLNEALIEEHRPDGNKNINFTSIFPHMTDTGLCKKPLVRFPSLLPLNVPEVVAQETISAIKKNLHEHSIPSFLIPVNNFFRCLPQKIALELKDFTGSGLDAHDD